MLLLASGCFLLCRDQVRANHHLTACTHLSHGDSSGSLSGLPDVSLTSPSFESSLLDLRSISARSLLGHDQTVPAELDAQRSSPSISLRPHIDLLRSPLGRRCPPSSTHARTSAAPSCARASTRRRSRRRFRTASASNRPWTSSRRRAKPPAQPSAPTVLPPTTSFRWQPPTVPFHMSAHLSTDSGAELSARLRTRDGAEASTTERAPCRSRACRPL